MLPTSPTTPTSTASSAEVSHIRVNDAHLPDASQTQMSGCVPKSPVGGFSDFYGAADDAIDDSNVNALSFSRTTQVWEKLDATCGLLRPIK